MGFQCDRITQNRLTHKKVVMILVLIGSTLNVACYGLDAIDANAPLVINELCASNNSTAYDEQGDSDDWIELYNPSANPVDVAGLYLTDDLSNPTQWRFPLDRPDLTTLASGGYLLIWADNDTAQAGLHTNFKLDADGEDLGLFSDDGSTLIDSITFGEQATDISYGRFPDGGALWQYCSTPTANGPNTDAFVGVIDDLSVSVERGFYSDPFNLVLSCRTADVEIYLTTDGSNPITNGQPTEQASLYTAPITIRTNTCLRAVAIKTGWMPSPTATHTYLFDLSNSMKSLPIISIVGDEYQSLYEPNGVMAIVGGTYNSSGVWQSSGANSYNHPMQRGIDFERQISLEILDAPLQLNYQTDCGIRIHGSDYTRPRYTRGDDWLTCWVNYWPSMNTNKFSFNLFFRSRYGENRFEYPLFWLSEILSHQSLVLRGGHNDACTPFVKDEWARRLFREMGYIQVTGSFANLFINGQYKGYYNPTERLDNEFLQAWYDTDNEFDVITQSGLRDGDTDAWVALLDYVSQNDITDSEHYAMVTDQLDIANFIDYLILQIYIANFDWPGNNWDVHRQRTANSPFRFSIWDAEGLAETWTVGDRMDMTAFEDFPNWSGTPGLNHMDDPTSRIYRALKNNPDFRQQFADHVHQHFFNQGLLTQDHLLTRWWEVFGEVIQFLPETEHYPVGFVPTEFIPLREPYVLAAFAENGLFNLDVNAPTFFVNDIAQHGGSIDSSDLISMATDQGTLYYSLDGTDPRLPGTSTDSSETTENLVREAAIKQVWVPTASIGTAWRTDLGYNTASWQQGHGAVGYEHSSGYENLIEIDVEGQMYNQRTSCYIRIPFQAQTNDLNDLDELALNIRYDDGFVAYLNGIEIARRNFNGTPVWNSSASSDHSDSAALSLERIDIPNAHDHLNNGANLLAIHGLNRSTGSSDFLISASLQLIQQHITTPEIASTAIEYTGPFTLPHSTHLKARTLYKGQWSALNQATYAVGPVQENLRITEIMYHPADPNLEYIELTNIGAIPINIYGVKFTNGIDFTFESLELAPDQYVVVVQDFNAFTDVYGSTVLIAGTFTGRLDNNGERIELQDALGQIIHNFRYSDNWYPTTDGDGYSLALKNPHQTDLSTWSNSMSWRPSSSQGGSPGIND